MSPGGTYEDNMGRFRHESDERIDHLLSGTAPADEPVGEHLTRFVEDVRSGFVTAAPAELERMHLAAIVKEAQGLTSAPADVTSGPRSRTRRKSMLSTLFASLGVKVAAAATAAVVTAGGAAAATGALPDPVQQAVANAAEKVGVSLPNPEDEKAEASEDDKRVDDDVRTVLDDDSLTGRDKGGAVSDAADDNRQDGDRPGTSGVSPTVPSGDPTDQGENPPSGNPGYGVTPPAGDEDGEGDGSEENPTDYDADSHPTGRP
jgi:hypothetical protein